MPTTIRTPNGNVKSYTTVRLPTTYNRTITNENNFTTKKYNYTLVLLNNDSLQTHNKIESNGFTHQHQIAYKHSTGEIKVYQPKDTRELFYIDKHGQKNVAIPWKRFWLFKTITGSINAFSPIPDGPVDFISAIQKSDAEPILEYTLKNVLSMVEGNEKATKLANNGELIKAIKIFNQASSQ